MQVEEMAFKIGVRPRTIIYHLEKLKKWRLVEVKKIQKYGNKIRRNIWGLDLEHKHWVIKCYNNITTHFFDDNELEEMTSKNRTFRKTKGRETYHFSRV
jgi:DNA-binding transcriptional ArsR family regulator